MGAGKRAARSSDQRWVSRCLPTPLGTSGVPTHLFWTKQEPRAEQWPPEVKWWCTKDHKNESLLFSMWKTPKHIKKKCLKVREKGNVLLFRCTVLEENLFCLGRGDPDTPSRRLPCRITPRGWGGFGTPPKLKGFLCRWVRTHPPPPGGGGGGWVGSKWGPYGVHMGSKFLSMLCDKKIDSGRSPHSPCPPGGTSFKGNKLYPQLLETNMLRIFFTHMGEGLAFSDGETPGPPNERPPPPAATKGPGWP